MPSFNVLLPSAIQANYPQKISFLTTVYVTTMGIATALAPTSLYPLLSNILEGADSLPVRGLSTNLIRLVPQPWPQSFPRRA